MAPLEVGSEAVPVVVNGDPREVPAGAAGDPVRMALAMKLAVEAGRLAHLAGRMPHREGAVPSSPLLGMLG